MDPREALARSQQQFAVLLAAVPDGAWTAPTPCEDWDVTALVRHVVGGDLMASTILAGGSRDDGLTAFAGADLGNDPLAAFESAAGALRVQFSDDAALSRTVAHPIGEIPGAVLLSFRYGDHVMHAWDLARATGGDERLDPELVAQVWADLQPMAVALPATGMFGSGPSGTVPDDADLQTRLLDLVGRRP